MLLSLLVITSPAHDVLPIVCTDYTYDSELDIADGVPQMQLDVPGGELKLHLHTKTRLKLKLKQAAKNNTTACSPDISPIENIWCIIKYKICQRWPQTLQQLETYIRQERDQISRTPKLQKRIISMPDIFKLFWKEEEIIHHGVTPNMPPIMRPVAGNICYVICVRLWIKYWLMWFEILLAFILFKCKKNIPTFPEFGLFKYINVRDNIQTASKLFYK